MPRPKVPQNQRQRAAEACNFCREAKKRCSGTAPCTHCVRRGLQSDCFITYLPRGSRAKHNRIANSAASKSNNDRNSPITLPLSTPSAQQTARGLLSPSEASSRARQSSNVFPEAGDFRPLSPSVSREGDDHHLGNIQGLLPNDDPTSERSSQAGSARMLLSQHGERVYIGGAASLSFLQIVRGIVSDQIGPSSFSHNDKSDTMLETQSPQAHLVGADQGCSVQELDPAKKLELVQCYNSVTEGFMDVFQKQEIESILASPNSPGNETIASAENRRLMQASADLVIAIGAQCLSSSTANDIGEPYFRGAQRQAFAAMLENPDLHMIRTFLLMAFYMLGDCRRNAAYMYLSIAARAAIALGLHNHKSYLRRPGDEATDQLRLRVWMSVCVMDRLVNSILGRPAATAGVHLDLKPGIESLLAGDESHTTECLASSYNIVSIIHDITNKLYGKKEMSLPVVENLLQEIELWRRQLPQSLRTLTNKENGSPQTQRQSGAIGNVCVSCLYYFAVTLVTRPILITTLATQPSNAPSSSPLAMACIEAAVYLAQTCLGALRAGLLYKNMCIMKALVFAAGLILGFESFAKSGVDDEVEHAFHGAEEVLRFLANQSPQAAHYLDILGSLSSAIASRRSRLNSGKRSRYVSKLFTLDNIVQSDEAQVPPRTPWPRFEAPDDSVVDPVLGTAGDGMNWQDTQQEAGELLIDWESLDISQWDAFPFVQ